MAEAWIIDAVRSPRGRGKTGGGLAHLHPQRILAQVLQGLQRKIGFDTADVEDVVSYYSMFFTKPVGKYVLSVCRTLSCALNGAERVTEAICGSLGIAPGQTDSSGTFTLIEAECLGACDRAPVLMINDAWQENVKPDDIGSLLDALRARGEEALSGCHHVIERKR